MNNTNISALTDICYECGNCFKCCPVQAITMVQNDFGCSHAFINEAQCLHCGQCKEICPACNPIEKHTPRIAYAAISKSPEANHSTSGGIFFELASIIIELGGIVIGAAYDFKTWAVRQVAVSKKTDITFLQGSKYVKSDVGDSYQKAKNFLELGKWVLYSGTPCQIAGLKRYLQKDYSTLLTVDLICHGTPPAKLFKDYIQYLEKKRHIAISDFAFRFKEYGHQHIGQYTYKKGNRIRKKPLYSAESSYFSLFLSSAILSDSCYTCDFADTARVGDITLGDFWGVRTELPRFFTDNSLPLDSSVSALMVNTVRGAEIADKIKGHLIYQPVDYDQIVRNNSRLNHQKNRDSSVHDILLTSYKDNGYNGIAKYFQKHADLKKYKMRIRRNMPQFLKKMIKKLFIEKPF